MKNVDNTNLIITRRNFLSRLQLNLNPTLEFIDVKIAKCNNFLLK